MQKQKKQKPEHQNKMPIEHSISVWTRNLFEFSFFSFFLFLLWRNCFTFHVILILILKIKFRNKPLLNVFCLECCHKIGRNLTVSLSTNDSPSLIHGPPIDSRVRRQLHRWDFVKTFLESNVRLDHNSFVWQLLSSNGMCVCVRVAALIFQWQFYNTINNQ